MDDAIDVTVVLVRLREREPWRGQAACRGAPAAVFYADRGDARRVQRVMGGLCDRCPVRWPCLAHGVAHREPGVWGGTTEQDRSRLRRGKPRQMRHDGQRVTVDWDARRQAVRLWEQGRSTVWTTAGAAT